MGGLYDCENYSKQHVTIFRSIFFLQATTSLISGALLLNPLVDPENISKTMLKLASHASVVLASIFGDLLTALGIVCLAAILYTVTGKQNKAMAIVALGFLFFSGIFLLVRGFQTSSQK